MTEALRQIEKDLEAAEKLVEEAVEKELSKRTYQKRLKALKELFWARERLIFRGEEN